MSKVTAAGYRRLRARERIEDRRALYFSMRPARQEELAEEFRIERGYVRDTRDEIAGWFGMLGPMAYGLSALNSSLAQVTESIKKETDDDGK